MTGDKIVLMDDLAAWPDDGLSMQFRLTYAGPLPASQGEPRGQQQDPRADVKHRIRQDFHRQLKRLWAVDRNLNGSPRPVNLALEEGPEQEAESIEELSRLHAKFGWNFVPLVTEGLHLLCKLDILFLRPSQPGKVIWAGDIDNRLKTLFDALKVPDAQDRYVDRFPLEDERPFFCLLEDDKLITSVAVETEQMLQPVGDKFDAAHVRLVIGVHLRPYFGTWTNDRFA